MLRVAEPEDSLLRRSRHVREGRAPSGRRDAAAAFRRAAGQARVSDGRRTVQLAGHRAKDDRRVPAGRHGTETVDVGLIGRLPRVSTRARLAVLILVVAVVGFVAYQQSRPPAPDLSLEMVLRAKVLVVGIDPSYPPFEVVNG